MPRRRLPDYTQNPVPADERRLSLVVPCPCTPQKVLTLPSATSPLARLPFQAGVCMRLGYGYFRTCFEPYRWNRALPFVFLFHAADLADFSQVPYRFSDNLPSLTCRWNSGFCLARRFLQTIAAHRPILTTEDWLA